MDGPRKLESGDFGGKTESAPESASGAAWTASVSKSGTELHAGVGNALNVFGSFAPMYYGRDPIEADREALRSDWQMVGRDMRSVMRQFELIHRKELEAHGTPLHIVKCED